MYSVRSAVASFGAAVLLLQLSAAPASSGSPSIDVETMKLKRMIDKPRRSAIGGGIGGVATDGAEARSAPAQRMRLRPK